MSPFMRCASHNVRYGDAVVVIGLGVLGLLATRMAVQAGAESVFAVDMLPSRRAWALAARRGRRVRSP